MSWKLKSDFHLISCWDFLAFVASIFTLFMLEDQKPAFTNLQSRHMNRLVMLYSNLLAYYRCSGLNMGAWFSIDCLQWEGRPLLILCRLLTATSQGCLNFVDCSHSKACYAVISAGHWTKYFLSCLFLKIYLGQLSPYVYSETLMQIHQPWNCHFIIFGCVCFFPLQI